MASDRSYSLSAAFRRSPLLMLAMLLVCSAFAQKKSTEQRDPSLGWYLPLKGKVYAGGERTRDCVVELFKDNKLVSKLPVGKKGDFGAQLDLGATYTLRISQEGHHVKFIHIDASLREDIVAYPPYSCLVNLTREEEDVDIDPFYVDFPSAVVRYDEELGGFYHSEGYLAHIQTKQGSIAQVKP